VARNIECKCEFNFTCGYCLRNAPPPHSTSYNPDLIDARLGYKETAENTKNAKLEHEEA